MHFQFFVDFDGTIAATDVGHTLFLTFVTNSDAYLAVEEAWLRGKVSSTVLYRVTCEHIQVTPVQLKTFLDRQKIDPSFKPFLDFAKKHRDEVFVLSDGFKNYITPLFENAGIRDLAIYANEFKHQKNGSIAPVFPFEHFTCGKCANCKGYQVRRLRNAEMTTVFIGDGNSDRCGAVECDYVFAKSDLKSFCKENQIEYFPFRDFHDIIKKITGIRSRR